MPVFITGYANHDQPVVDYSASYATAGNKEPAATLENLYPLKFPVEGCVMSLECTCTSEEPPE